MGGAGSMNVTGRLGMNDRMDLKLRCYVHLQTVAMLPAVERGGFLSRRTPWHMCASLAILTWFSALGCGRNRSQAFTFQSRMPPNLSGTASTCGVVSV